MICPLCEQAAPRGANFCFACGTSLARACPECRAGQSPDARFCPECGTDLGSGTEPNAAGQPEPEPAPRHDAEMLDDAALEEAIERVRRRESRRRIATVAGAMLLILLLLGGMALWMRTSPPALERAAGPLRPTEPLRPAEPVRPTEPERSTEPVRPAEPARPAEPPPAPVAATPAMPAPVPSAPSQPRPEVAEPPAPTGPALPARESLPATSRSPRVARAPEPVTPRPPVEREGPAALPDRARGDVRVEVTARRLGEGVTFYTVSLRERDGAPVTAAEVSIRGRRTDGELVEAALDATTDPGVYRAALRISDVRGARLRVASAGRIQEAPLPE
jgi:hypothetical protein